MRNYLSVCVMTFVWLTGCSVIMSSKDVDEQIKFMQQSNHSGCARIVGSGTPPASRVDGEILGAWGKDTMLKDCINYFEGRKP